jgi:hypothetical protein
MANRDYTIAAPDGREVTINGPEGASPDQLRQAAQRALSMMGPKKDPGILEKGGMAQNVAGGILRGAGSIGATLLAPIDYIHDKIDPQQNLSGLITGQKPLSRNEQRRKDMADALRMAGVDTDSTGYQVGKIGTEIAGTLGVGGALAPTVARVAPALAPAVASGGFQGANLAQRAAGGAITGAASAGLINPDEAATGAVIGGALPAIAKVAGAAGQKIGNAIKGGGVSPEVAALASRAKQLGIDVPADRLVQSKPLDAVASALNYVPFSGRAATEAKMSEQLNQALSKTFGENTPNVTQGLRQAEAKLGMKFDSFLQKNTVAMDQQFLQDLAAAANQAQQELGTEGASIIAKQVDEIVQKAASGAIDGQAAYNIKKTLDRIGRRNSPEAWYALDLKGKLMDALNRSVGPQEAAAFKELRQQYGNMLGLQKLAKNGAEGEISVARLANLKNINNPDLQELADIAAQFVKPREGQHGAMQRAVVGLGTASTAGPVGLAVGATAGRAANTALNSQTLRSLVSGQGTPLSALANPELAQFGYRAAPAIGADR